MKQTLIKIIDDHYVVVDDSEIKEGDWVVGCTRTVVQCMYPENVHHRDVKKITHSTDISWIEIDYIPLSEVKELLGEVDVEKKANDCIAKVKHNGSFIRGYNQAIEDNKDRKYTEKDIRKAIEMARDIKDDSAHDVFTAEDISGCAEVCTYGWRNRYKDEEIIRSLQPKTEWEVTFDEQGKLRLV